MKNQLLAATALTLLSGVAAAQTQQTGTVDGMPYVYQLPPGGCSAASPCNIVEYLHPLSSAGGVPSDLATYFGASWQAAHPNTIVVGPQLIGSDAAHNWGGVTAGLSQGGQFAIDTVKAIEAQYPTNPNTVTLTGWSMGGLGTESLMVAAGPRGNQQPGVYAAGLSYDGADYVLDAAIAKSTLCGVPLTLVHGGNDQSVPVAPDQSLAQTLSGCSGFTYNEIPGAGHGVGIAGLTDGSQLSQVMAQASGGKPSTASATTSTQTTTPSTAAPIASSASSTATVAATDVKPGSGQTKDSVGNTYTVTADGRVQMNGKDVPGGAETAAIRTVNGITWGLDSTGRGWFTLSSDGHAWTHSATPPPIAGDTTAAAAKNATPALPPVTTCAATPGGAATGSFTTQNGQIIGPDGKVFIAKGINVYDADMGSASKILATFPGLNFIRLATFSYAAPASFKGFVQQMSAAGVVVEIEHHMGAGGGVPALTGGDLAAENQWFAALAAGFKNNPNVWFGTINEPASGGGLAAEQQSNYQAIRGAGNNSIVMLSAPVDANTSGMTNVVIDQHEYGWTSHYSTDQAAVTNDLMNTIKTMKSAHGGIPLIIGETGPATDGQNLDPNAQQVIAAVAGSGHGFAWWNWDSRAPEDNLTRGGQLTSYGSDIATLIKMTSSAAASIWACSGAEMAAVTRTNINALTQAQQAAPEPAAAPTPTAPAAAATTPDTTTADAAIAEAQRIIARIGK